MSLSDLGDEILRMIEGESQRMPPESEPSDLFDADASDEKPEPPFGHKYYSDIMGYDPEFIPDIVMPYYGDQKGLPNVPKVNPFYVIPKKEMEAFALYATLGQTIKLDGCPGGGKSELPKQFAALTGRPFLRLNYNQETLPSDIVGQNGLRAGDTKYILGQLPKFVTLPAVILHDEWDRAINGIGLAIFQRHLEDKGCPMPENDVTPYQEAHPDLIVCGASNTKGLGDDDGKYGSANVQDTSTLNRWKASIPLDYPTQAEQQGIIKRLSPRLKDAEAGRIANFAVRCQNAYKAGELPLTFSIRNLEAVLPALEVTKDIVFALEHNYLNSLDKESADAVRGFIKSIWNR